jgi:hypothetical protein
VSAVEPDLEPDLVSAVEPDFVSEPDLVSAVELPLFEVSEELFDPLVEVSDEDFVEPFLFISPEVLVDDFVSAEPPLLSCAESLPLLPSARPEPDLLSLSRAWVPEDSRDIEPPAEPPSLLEAAPGDSPFAPPWLVPCAAANPVAANNAAAATEIIRRFFI